MKIDETLKISVVIPTKNRFKDIIKCIESIMIQTLLPDEIVIVDASDTLELFRVIKQQFSENVKIIYIPSKPGLTSQRNIGIKASSGDIVFFLDDDVVLDKNFIKEILNVFENDKEGKIGGVCGDIIPIDSKNVSYGYSILRTIYISINTAIATIFFLYMNTNNGKFRLSGLPTYAYGSTKVVNVECIPGGLTAYRREVLDEFKFDENLQGYCWGEDDDFSYRVSRKYTNVYTPYAKVIHNSTPLKKNKKYDRMKMIIENHHYLFKKNFPQKLKNKFAFYMSIIGLLILELMNSIIHRNAEGLRGLLSGIIAVILINKDATNCK